MTAMFVIFLVTRLVTTSTSTAINTRTDPTTGGSISSTTTRRPCSVKYEQLPPSANVLSIAASAHVVADFNNDARLDLAFGKERYRLMVLLGNGDGTFGEMITSVDLQYNGFNGMIASDFNNDHRADLAFTDFSMGYIYIAVGLGNGTFEKKTILRLGNQVTVALIATADVNLDGYPDLAASILFQDVLYVFLGDGDGMFSTSMTLTTAAQRSTGGFTVADLNNDVYPDIVVTDFLAQSIGVFYNRGDGTFHRETILPKSKVDSPFFVATGDFNNDKLVDIAVSSYTHQFVTVMLGCGNGTFGKSSRFSLGDAWTRQPLYVNDFNNDAHLDIAFGKIDQSVHVLMGTGDGSFQLKAAFVSRYNPRLFSVSLGDLNSDGHNDILFFDRDKQAHQILLSTCE